MLTFLQSVDSRRARYKCECGAEIVAWKSNVSTGHTKSCGCLRRKASSERSKTHGHKSGGKRSRAYVAWMNMKSRCNNQNRKDAINYLERGVTYDPNWESFERFLADMGEPPPKLTLDRRENDLGYSKSNCRWATHAVQNLNRRNCVRYELNGKSQTLAEWSRETGIGRVTMLKRIQSGVPLVLALSFKGNLCSLRSQQER